MPCPRLQRGTNLRRRDKPGVRAQSPSREGGGLDRDAPDARGGGGVADDHGRLEFDVVAPAHEEHEAAGLGAPLREGDARPRRRQGREGIARVREEGGGRQDESALLRCRGARGWQVSRERALLLRYYGDAIGRMSPSCLATSLAERCSLLHLCFTLAVISGGTDSWAVGFVLGQFFGPALANVLASKTVAKMSLRTTVREINTSSISLISFLISSVLPYTYTGPW